MHIDTLPIWMTCDWSWVCERCSVVQVVRELRVSPCLKGANVFTFTHSVAEWLFNFMCVTHPRLWANCHVNIPRGQKQLRFMDRRRQRRLRLRTHTQTCTQSNKRSVLNGGINLLCLNFAQRKILELTLWRERWAGALHARSRLNSLEWYHLNGND